MQPRLLIALLSIVLVVMLLSLRVGPAWLVNTTAPVHQAISGGLRQLSSFTSWFGDVHQLSQERDALAAERNQLQSELAKSQAQQRDTAAIQRQLAQSTIPAQQLLLAHAAGLVSRGSTQFLLIDKGSDDGLKSGQMVLADGVLVGRLKEVESRVSTVQLPQSQGSIIPAVIRYPDSQTKGVVEGSYNLSARLTQVLPTEKLEAGSTILTSGEGGTYPANLVIGKVGAMNQEQSAFRSASVVLPWDITKLETVFVLK